MGKNSKQQNFKFHVEDVVLKENVDPPRLDAFLSAKLPDLSRSRIQKLIEDGSVTVDGGSAKSSHKLKVGETISIVVPMPKALAIDPQDIAIGILFQDEHIAVVDKPAGMVTHPGAGVDSGTLVHALMHHMQGSLSGIGGVYRPGIVHRLDKDTSGLLVIAKSDLSHRHLAKQIEAKEARRTYLALVEGVPERLEGRIVAPVGRDPHNRKRMAIVENGRRAESIYRVLNASHRFALLQVDLLTGRTHQIRVHMQSLNCPVVGDLVYNKRSTGSLVARNKLGLVGHALHAHRLRFTHPVDGRLLEFESKLPADFAQVVCRLLGDAGSGA